MSLIIFSPEFLKLRDEAIDKLTRIQDALAAAGLETDLWSELSPEALKIVASIFFESDVKNL